MLYFCCFKTLLKMLPEKLKINWKIWGFVFTSLNDFNQPELDLYVCLEDTEAETWHWLHPLYFSVANTRTLFGDQRTLPKYFERLPCLTVSSFGADDASPVPTSHTAPYQIPTACTMPYRCLKVDRLDR